MGTFMWVRESMDRWHKYGFLAGSNDLQRTSDGAITGHEMFDSLCENDARNYMMGASIMPTGGPNPRPDGLVEGHAYSLLQVKVVNNIKLLLFRNPWAQLEWKGKWSDTDVDTWNRHPEVKQILRPEFANDGLFWMCWEDCRRIWTGVDVCCRAMRHGSDARHKHQHPGDYWRQHHLRQEKHRKDQDARQGGRESLSSNLAHGPSEHHHIAGHHHEFQHHNELQQDQNQVHHKAHHHRAHHRS